MKISTGWQLAVVDWDQLKSNPLAGEGIRKAIDKLLANSQSSTFISSGEVVFICNFKDNPVQEKWSGEYFNVATVWVPSSKKYMRQAVQSLRPILSEEDATEITLKYGTDFSKWI